MYKCTVYTLCVCAVNIPKYTYIMFLAGSVAAVYTLYYIILRQVRVRVRVRAHTHSIHFL